MDVMVEEARCCLGKQEAVLQVQGRREKHAQRKSRASIGCGFIQKGEVKSRCQKAREQRARGRSISNERINKIEGDQGGTAEQLTRRAVETRLHG